jgi:FdhD protein
MSMYEEFNVLIASVDDGQVLIHEENRKVIQETSLKIVVNGSELVSMLCTNKDLEELAMGFLFNEGVISGFADIADIYVNERSMAVIVNLKEDVPLDRSESLRSITSGCGKCYTYINPLKKRIFSVNEGDTRYSIVDILDNMNGFIDKSDIFKSVGGVHSAQILFGNKPAVAGGESKNAFFEDIGRHNCFDKVAGYVLKNGLSNEASDSVMYVSGRISSEIVTKLIRMGIPVISSRTTPTAAAVKLAEEFGITILGFVRGRSCNIYSHPQRLY